MTTTALAPSAQIIHHGTLDVPASANAAYLQAKAYLSHDRIERGLFDKLEHARDGRHYRLSINNRNDDHFDPLDNTIAWDPYSALCTTQGGRQSPALGLGHEVDHAVEGPAAEKKLRDTPVAAYDNAEERRVIRGSETHAARTLGEAIRRDHSGSTYRVSSPISR